jgi:hypothetical protein
MNKKALSPIFIGFIIFIVILSGVGSYYFISNNILSVGGDTFVKPSWARLECAPTDANEGGYSKWLDQQSTFNCDVYTESCEFQIENTGAGFSIDPYAIRGYYSICNLAGTSCGSKNYYRYEVKSSMSLWIEIPSGKSVKFDTGSLIIGEDSTKISLRWKPWQLYRIVGGSKWIVNSENCDIISSARSKIRQEDSVDKLYRQGAEGVKWVNYVNDWNYGPATNIFNHATYGEVYCTAGQIFDIVELRMVDSSLKKLDPTYSGTLNNGETLKGLGNKLGNVECCPNEANCKSDFTYDKVSNIPEAECFSDLQCFNLGGYVPISQTSYVTYNCINEKCVKSNPIAVECTTSAQCSDGKICDLSTTNYGHCINQVNNEYCGDDVCQITESSTSCPTDCANADKINCINKGGNWIQGEIVKKGKGFLGIGKFVGLYDEVQKPGICRIPHMSILAIILSLIGILIIVFAIIKSFTIAILPGLILALAGIIWIILAGGGYV